MAQNDIGIDLGTTTIIIAQEGKGVVLNQPSVVAMDTRKKTVLEAGDKALAMVGRTPNYISAIFPLKDGVISDHTMTRELICRFVKQVYSSHMVKPRVAVCVPAAITGIESDAVVEAVVAAGARQVYLIDEPIAAALGSGIDITQPEGRMIIDIGGGTTDIAVLSLGGKVKATSVRVAGNHYDEEILKHVRNKYSIAIGQRTAEELKKQLETQNEMDGPVFKIKDDPRITRVGKFIRKTSLDELPQLWNILKGDMSIVGPRPALPREVEQYGDYEKQRLYVTPGLSCYWQIAPHRNDLSFEEWMDLDIKYVKERSFWVDWKIIFKTFKVCLLGHGE